MNFNKAEFIRSAASAKDFPRDTSPRILFAGRSNVGKSSTINTLLQRKNFARVSASPGKQYLSTCSASMTRFGLWICRGMAMLRYPSVRKSAFPS